MRTEAAGESRHGADERARRGGTPRRAYFRYARAVRWSILGLAVVVVACSDGGGAIVDARTDGLGVDGAAGADAAGVDGAGVDGAGVDGAVIDGAVIDGPGGDAAEIDGGAVDATGQVDAADGVDAAVDADAAGGVDADGVDAVGTTAGCADGTREALVDAVAMPLVAGCAGAWSGDVGGAGALCAVGWHVCNGSEPALRAVTYAAAVAAPGCFAIDAAQDNYQCLPDCSAQVAAGIDTAANIDLGGVGADCPFRFPGAGGCLADGRIDAAENSGTGCDYNPAVTNGVTCCADVVVSE